MVENNNSKLKEMNKKNTSTKTQVCYQSEYGILIRRPACKYFYQCTEEETKKTPVPFRTHVLLEQIPIDMIKPVRGPKNKQAYCVSCHKQFDIEEIYEQKCRACFCNYDNIEERLALDIRGHMGRSESVFDVNCYGI